MCRRTRESRRLRHKVAPGHKAGGDQEEAGSGGAKRKLEEEVTDAEIVP